MRYALAILTHGRSRTLPSALARFVENVYPLPHRIHVFADASQNVEGVVGAVRGYFPSVEDPTLSATHPSRQQGFCRATARLWERCAADEDVDHVFWLEHDFLVERRVSLEQLAGLLDADRDLAQVALVRQAANDEERAAGGLIQSRRSAFLPRRSAVPFDGVELRCDWLEHRSFFTTNPSLMRREFMRENPFPDDGVSECEGRFGIELVRCGYRFGYWGDGHPWVSHVGVRDGVGY